MFDFSINPWALISSACRRTIAGSFWLMIRIRDAQTSRSIIFAASRPFMFGIETSMMIRSGRNDFASSTAWRPSAASAANQPPLARSEQSLNTSSDRLIIVNNKYSAHNQHRFDCNRMPTQGRWRSQKKTKHSFPRFTAPWGRAAFTNLGEPFEESAETYMT